MTARSEVWRHVVIEPLKVVEIQSEEELDSIIAADDRPVSCLAALFQLHTAVSPL